MQKNLLRQSKSVWRLAACCLCLTLLTASAAAPNAEPQTLSSALPDMGAAVIRLLGALAIVLAVFFGGVWLFRNWQRLAIKKGRAPRLNILEAKSLGNRQAIYIVGYDQQRFLVSSSSAGINLLATLPDSETAAEPAPAPASAFLQTLQQALSPKP